MDGMLWAVRSPAATGQENVSLFFDFGDISAKRVVADDISAALLSLAAFALSIAVR
jgi:hypothetical protein